MFDENYYYACEVHLRNGENFTMTNLKDTLHFILIDDELTFRQSFPAHIIVTGISLDELTRCVTEFDCHDGIIPDSNYSWKFDKVVAGDKHPEVHVLLTAVN